MSPSVFPSPPCFQTGKTGKTGKPNNGATFRFPGFDFQGLAKPGNRENWTAPDHNGNVRGGFPMPAPQTRRGFDSPANPS